MAIRIKSVTELKRRLDSFMDTLSDGPVFVAKKTQVRAVLMDLQDYYALLEELEDLNELLRQIGDCECGCAGSEVADRLYELGHTEQGD